MILIPLPHYGFDPTESAVPWEYLTSRGVEIVFATPNGKAAAADERLITGRGFGVFKTFLMANDTAIEAYQRMSADTAFKHPISYSEIKVSDYDGLILPGGHDKGMKTYLESSVLQAKVAKFFAEKKIIGAICHGTILAIRTINPQNQRSVLYDYQTTSPLKMQEMSAYYLTVLWLGDYYRTYPITVEDEVKSGLKSSKQFQSGAFSLRRDSLKNESPAFVTEDRNYLSARWPGDAYTFSKRFYHLLKKVK